MARKRILTAQLTWQNLVMLVTLTPGVDRDRVLELLRTASVTIVNNHGEMDRYATWVPETARMLRGQIARSDLEQLLFTPAYYRLIDPALRGTPQGLRLLDDELAESSARFIAAYQTLLNHIQTWKAAAGMTLAVVDSSVFLSHPKWARNDDSTAVIASIPWAEEIGARAEDVLLVLPEVVIRELDRLKESSNKTLRYRALVTLAVIDRLLPDPNSTVLIRARDDWNDATERGMMPRGAIQLRVFYDDRAHRPLADADAEIIDRAAAVQTLAGQRVRLMTMDTTMGLNARRAGLQVVKPKREIEAPPAEMPSTRARRKDHAPGRRRTATAFPTQRRIPSPPTASNRLPKADR